ncbi:conditioned medium-induced protein 4 [Halorarius halobius]|uniref:conditioned medium-induced protein 4 n=1 Tax=Halorarius halobius TaxID=2962671 RepID=UPI0020CC8DF1|nr:conditioned medium-induced protein 4 [Halorarius halobius]
MDEKTEELRDIFIDVTDEDTVTEEQADERGSLTGQDGDADRVREVVAEMREATEFGTDLDDEALARVVRGFYEGDSDTDIAEALDVSRSVVFRARMDLHLVRERDTDAPFTLADLREMLAADMTVDAMAEELDVSASTVRRYVRVVEAQNAARRVSHRFQSEFEDAFTDADLSANMTEEVKEDGLEDATEGMETDVSF